MYGNYASTDTIQNNPNIVIITFSCIYAPVPLRDGAYPPVAGTYVSRCPYDTLSREGGHRRLYLPRFGKGMPYSLIEN